MADETESPEPDGRRVYVRPQVRIVELRPEEAVLGNCKSGSMAGPGQPACNTPSNCFSLGS